MSTKCQNLKPWWLGWITLLLLIGLLVFNLRYDEWIVDEISLGFIALIVLINFALIMRPYRISAAGIEIEAKVEKIQKNLRPYAIIKRQGIVHSTFENGLIEILDLVINSNEQKLVISLAEKPKYIEFREWLGSGFSIKMLEKDHKYIYTCSVNSGYFNPDTSFIVEAFFD
jgi:hypothetical protein